MPNNHPNEVAQVRPLPGVLNYSGYRDWKGWRSDTFGCYSQEQALYFAEELRLSGVASLEGKTVLEIGFGNGEFAGWARDRGANYHGTECIRELVDQGASNGFNTHDGLAPLDSILKDQRADLIVAFDVFEHLHADALLQTLRSALCTLKPMGRLIGRVPSGDSPFSRAVQHGDSTHRMVLGSSMIRQMALDAGFTVRSVREPAFPLRGLGGRVFLRRGAVAAVRASAFALITRVFMGGGQPVLTPTLTFVLEKPF